MKRKILFVIILIPISLLCGLRMAHAQSAIDYEKAMEDIMVDYLSDYPDATIRAFDLLFAETDIDELPTNTKFLYYYYYGACLETVRPDDAILYLTRAREIAADSYLEVGIRDSRALDAEYLLADLHFGKGTEEHEAVATFLYNDIITVGISLLDDPDIGSLVIQSLVQQAKMGVELWQDPEWVKKMWLQVRDIVLESDGETDYPSYYLLNVLHYYCDLDDYETALVFMEDARNKEILKEEAAAYCNYIQDITEYIGQIEILNSAKGIRSMDFWSNKLRIATIATVLCSNEKSISLLQEVEQGLVQNNLTESHEFAQVLYLLSTLTFDQPEIAESYYAKQIDLLNTTPQYFIFLRDTDAFNSLGVCQMKQGRYIEAQENYQKALSCLTRDPSYSDSPDYKMMMGTIYHNCGRNLYFLGEYKESVEFFSLSIALQEEANGTVMPKTRVYMSESRERIKK